MCQELPGVWRLRQPSLWPPWPRPGGLGNPLDIISSKHRLQVSGTSQGTCVRSEGLILGSLYKNLYPLTITMVLYLPCASPCPPALGDDAVLPLGVCIIFCLSHKWSEGQDGQMVALLLQNCVLSAMCHLGLWWVWDMGTHGLQHRDTLISLGTVTDSHILVV